MCIVGKESNNKNKNIHRYTYTSWAELFADLLAFLAECKHGFKTFSNQDTLTEFVKSNQYTPKALFGHKKLLENSETNFMDDFSDSVNKLKQLVADDGFLYVSAGFNQDLSEQQNGFEFFMISCHE